jgi:hypothetical protein
MGPHDCKSGPDLGELKGTLCLAAQNQLAWDELDRTAAW